MSSSGSIVEKNKITCELRHNYKKNVFKKNMSTTYRLLPLAVVVRDQHISGVRLREQHDMNADCMTPSRPPLTPAPLRGRSTAATALNFSQRAETHIQVCHDFVSGICSSLCWTGCDTLAACTRDNGSSGNVFPLQGTAATQWLIHSNQRLPGRLCP